MPPPREGRRRSTAPEDPARDRCRARRADPGGPRRLGAGYEIFPCDPELADTTVFCERYGYPPERSANTILVKAKTGGERSVACVVLAHTPARREPHGAQASRPRAGSRSRRGRDPRGHRHGDRRGHARGPARRAGGMGRRRIMACEWVILGGGDRSSKIKVSPALFEGMPGASVIEGLALVGRRERGCGSTCP